MVELIKDELARLGLYVYWYEQDNVTSPAGPAVILAHTEDLDEILKRNTALTIDDAAVHLWVKDDMLYYWYSANHITEVRQGYFFLGDPGLFDKVVMLVRELVCGNVF